MLKLAADVADAWNTCWLGRASELPEKILPMRGACAAAGRNPATLELSVGQIVYFSGLEPGNEYPGGIERFEFANPRNLAAEWQVYADQGVGQIVVWPVPGNDECYDLLTSGLAIYRNGNPN